jgi:hypothetical protein
MKEPRWYVVSKKNLDSFIEKVEKEAGQLVFMAMTPGDYEMMWKQKYKKARPLTRNRS